MIIKRKEMTLDLGEARSLCLRGRRICINKDEYILNIESRNFANSLFEIIARNICTYHTLVIEYGTCRMELSQNCSAIGRTYVWYDKQVIRMDEAMTVEKMRLKSSVRITYNDGSFSGWHLANWRDKKYACDFIEHHKDTPGVLICYPGMINKYQYLGD